MRLLDLDATHQRAHVIGGDTLHFVLSQPHVAVYERDSKRVGDTEFGAMLIRGFRIRRDRDALRRHFGDDFIDIIGA